MDYPSLHPIPRIFEDREAWCQEIPYHVKTLIRPLPGPSYLTNAGATTTTHHIPELLKLPLLEIPLYPPTPRHTEAFGHIFSTIILPLPSLLHLHSNCCSFSATLKSPEYNCANDLRLLLPPTLLELDLQPRPELASTKLAKGKNDLHTN